LNRWIITSGLAGALALPLLIAPATASASCNDRKVAGTVVGGVGGALIGNSIAHGGGGAVLGGLGGAVLGHEIARSSCRHEYRHAEYYHGRYRPSGTGYGTNQGAAYQSGGAYPSAAQSAPTPSQQTVYYDDRGNVVYPSSAPGPSAPYASYASASYPSAASACSAETRSYYNDRGELVQRQVQTCAP
jgi:hypothetical protein